MKCSEIINRLKRIDKLINQGTTGTPEEFANRLHISRSQLYNHIDMLKDFGAPIKYNKTLNSFQYEGDFKIQIDFNIKIISENENIIINAGNFIKSFESPMKLDATNIFLLLDLLNFDQNMYANPI